MNAQTLRRYFVATFFSLAVAAFYASQLFIESNTLDIRLINKSLANTSITLLGIVLLLGPFSRLYDIVDSWLKYRKEFGILAFFTGLLHVYFIMFPLARRGPFGFYLARPFPAYTGLAGLIIMFFLLIISFDKIKNLLGVSKWWKMQYNGVRIAALSILVHIAVLRYEVWTSILLDTKRLTFLPPSLWVGIFSTYVLLVRFTELIGGLIARILILVWTMSLVGTIVWLLLR